VVREVLADTAFFVALIDARDRLHGDALALARELDRARATMVTRSSSPRA
jgi:hypothetical protein